jgi:hypothetical protein
LEAVLISLAPLCCSSHNTLRELVGETTESQRSTLFMRCQRNHRPQHHSDYESGTPQPSSLHPSHSAISATICWWGGVSHIISLCQESAVDSTANMGQVTFLSRLDILGVLPCFTLFSRKNRVSLRYGSGDIWQVYTRVAARAIVAWRPLSCSGS